MSIINHIESYTESTLKAFPFMLQTSSFIFGFSNPEHFKFLGGIIITEFVIALLKFTFSKISPNNDWWKRPDGKTYTKFFLLRDKPEEFQITKAGFPSGHSGTMGFFFTWTFLNKNPKSLLKNPFVEFIISIVVAGSRLHYKCHTFIQITVGYTIGCIIAYNYHNFVKYMIILNKESKLKL